MRKERLLQVAREVDEEMSGEGKQETLNEQEQRGLKPLQRRIKDGEIIIMETEKSGRFSVCTLEDYLTAGDLHIQAGREIDEKKYRGS